jgi:exodeoxyribonuclease VII large subunit
MSDPRPLSVTDLTRQLKDLVEANFPLVWVQGEVSNCTRAASGHVYLTLKDDTAQMRAVMWRQAASRLKFDIHDGLEVIAAGPIEIYQPRGTYQLIVEQLVPQGLGALELAFRQLQEKLAAAGLFDAERKRPLPRFPRRIALITSPTSAAVRDMLQVITRRWPATDIVILPVAVQGEGAGAEIAAALETVGHVPNVDVVIAGRGGGSLEDLWAFNEEIVARAIYACPIPVVSAVGHEIDVTIADLVADRRALTPSEAGELVVPHRSEIEGELRALQNHFVSALRDQAQRARLQLDTLAALRVFAKPLEPIHDLERGLDELTIHLKRGASRHIEHLRQQVALLASSLDALSPLRVLDRGYTITRRVDSTDVIREAAHVETGETIETLLKSGRLLSRVESIDVDDSLSLDRPAAQGDEGL